MKRNKKLLNRSVMKVNSLPFSSLIIVLSSFIIVLRGSFPAKPTIFYHFVGHYAPPPRIMHEHTMDILICPSIFVYIGIFLIRIHLVCFQVHSKILTIIAIICEICALVWWVCLFITFFQYPSSVFHSRI